MRNNQLRSSEWIIPCRESCEYVLSTWSAAQLQQSSWIWLKTSQWSLKSNSKLKSNSSWQNLKTRLRTDSAETRVDRARAADCCPAGMASQGPIEMDTFNEVVESLRLDQNIDIAMSILGGWTVVEQKKKKFSCFSTSPRWVACCTGKYAAQMVWSCWLVKWTCLWLCGGDRRMVSIMNEEKLGSVVFLVCWTTAESERKKTRLR